MKNFGRTTKPSKNFDIYDYDFHIGQLISGNCLSIFSAYAYLRIFSFNSFKYKTTEHKNFKSN